MAEVLRQYRSLLTQIVETPHRGLDSFTLVTDEARQYLPDPSMPLDSQWRGGVHELFHVQAERAPEHMAVADPHVTWTYRKLDDLSNRIAGSLLRNGVESESVVAIYSHRSAPLVAALLGVMKTGAAFLVLDPEYPATRLVEYLQLARPRALLHQEAA